LEAILLLFLLLFFLRLHGRYCMPRSPWLLLLLLPPGLLARGLVSTSPRCLP
jgi:hypothetical protein